jgi:hypothetical protein
MEIKINITGADETKRNFEKLAQRAPGAARQAVNRTIGVARSRVIKTVSRQTGISRRVLGGRKTRMNRQLGARVRGHGYIKQIKATRRRQAGALVGLVAGVRHSRTGRARLVPKARVYRKPGGLGRSFPATMRSGHIGIFERVPVQARVSNDASKSGRRRVATIRKNLPIREVVYNIRHPVERAIRVHMKRAARTVYPQKLWEELEKRIPKAR